ncbi:diguanylate cyclase [Enterobacteriaceae bacterium RIT691]|nr:diguanylate cyclase [Enterobacteriaceae bacterium RIT691]
MSLNHFRAKSSVSSRFFYALSVAIGVIFILSTALSWKLIGNEWENWREACADITQFHAFHAALDVSNDLAGERAYSHELLFCHSANKEQCWNALVTQRQKTDTALAKIPLSLQPAGFMPEMQRRLATARQKIDMFRDRLLMDPGAAGQAIDSMMAATDYYHSDLFRHISSLLLLNPAALGPTLRAQALGELRDESGKLGAEVLLPLKTRTPIPERNRETLVKGIQRIETDWKILEIQGKEYEWMPEFGKRVQNTQQIYEQEGIPLIRTLMSQSDKGQPYGMSADDFARHYHASLREFNDLLARYMKGLNAYYQQEQKEAMLQFYQVIATLIALYTAGAFLLIYCRTRILKPVISLNAMIENISNGQAQAGIHTEDADFHGLFPSLNELKHRLNEDSQLIRALQSKSETDALTSLFNRGAFDDKATQMLAVSGPEMPVWLIMLDIDHFKSVNDTWGHPVGDDVLVALAATLKHNSQQQHTLARLGGEEFAIIFPAAEASIVVEYASAIQRAIRALRFSMEGDVSLQITSSFGIASGWSCTLSELLKNADDELYRAKKSGRDRICIRS